MSKKSKFRNRPTPLPKTPVQPKPIHLTKQFAIIAAALSAIILAVAYFYFDSRMPKSHGGSIPKTESFVGASVCKTCHESQFAAWTGSHHQQAMQAASAATVLGNFADAQFKLNGVDTTFYKRGDQFMVRTDGPDGKLTDYEIAYTFGVYPLQQYLIAFPGGRYQMLPIAWDARTKKEGGQRWFHLYPKQKIDHNDPLHWTGVYQNWALQCAECHTTNLHKGYDAASNTYQTTYSEINVACESCHGPGGEHVRWAKEAKPPYASGNTGMPSLASHWNDAWKFPDPKAKYAVRDRQTNPASSNSCAACHARRSTLSEHPVAGSPLEDAHRLAMLTPPNYYADGQQREEDYVWGSFLQSKMYQRGVTCVDCHDPHTQKLRAEGNALCGRCHNAAEFDVPKHHQHQVNSQGAQCVACHMPTQNYMVIHAREDHSLRVPRPDLSIAIGSPNACNQCHTDTNPQWAAGAMDTWYGKGWRARKEYGQTLHAGSTQGLAALPALLDLAQDRSAPDIIRASALSLAQPSASPATHFATQKLLGDQNPQVRIGALGMLASADAPARVQMAAPVLLDHVRAVRIEAAQILADIPDAQLLEKLRPARKTAMQEYETALQLESDWPSGNVNLANLRLRQGRVDEAIAALQHAIALDPRFSDAYVNLADVYRQQQNDAQAEAVLRRGLLLSPRDADLHHALGLLLIRKGNPQGALKELVDAAKLAPHNARYAYVEAIALNSDGKKKEALTVLRNANLQHPGDIDILNALLSISREAGDRASELVYAKKLSALLPDNPDIQKLLSDLQKSH